MPYAGGGPRLHYGRTGNPDGEPLLWITGFTISAAVFDPILPLYEDRFDCITFDNRGAGRSAAPLRPISIPELAGDAVRVLDAAGLASAHVYGLSMGGMIAQEMAIRFPDRVRGLVLGGSTPGGPRAVRPSRGELAALGRGVLGAGAGRDRAWLAALLFSDAFRREHPDRVRALLPHFGAHRAQLHGRAGHLLATVYHDTVSRLSRIQAPTLVFHGATDAMAPLANAHLLVERIPDAELALVEGAGHAYLLERPEHSRDVLTGWIDRHGTIGPGRAPSAIARRIEPVTRAFGLPVGAVRTGRSLIGYVADRRSRPSRAPGTPSG